MSSADSKTHSNPPPSPMPSSSPPIKTSSSSTSTPKDFVQPMFVDVSSMTLEEFRYLARGASHNDRMAKLEPIILEKSSQSHNEEGGEEDQDCSTDFKKNKEKIQQKVLRQVELTWWQSIVMTLFLAYTVPTGVLMIPGTLFLLGFFIVGNIMKTFLWFTILVIVPLLMLPRQRYRPSILQSWMALAFCKYFSVTMIAEEDYAVYYDASSSHGHRRHRRIFVAPPHGVFPYGNILALVVWPTVFGHPFRGLTASSALRVPIFHQILRSIGCIDASRVVARAALEAGEDEEEDDRSADASTGGGSIGISTGGVMEVFETSPTMECIVLRERKGVIKLAIQTGADLVPCYVFGNNQLLHAWSGEGLVVLPGGRNSPATTLQDILRYISRRVGFALVVIRGRFGLPIPFRKPVLCVAGRGIPTHHIQCEDPSHDLINDVQLQLLKGVEQLFDRYKGYYGWEDRTLIIK